MDGPGDFHIGHPVLPQQVEPPEGLPTPLEATTRRSGVRQRRHKFLSTPAEVRFNHPQVERHSTQKGSCGGFHELLGRLAEQHEGEVASLRAENAALRAQLGAQGEAASECDFLEAASTTPGSPRASILFPASRGHSLHSPRTSVRYAGLSIPVPEVPGGHAKAAGWKKNSREDTAPLCLMPPQRKSFSAESVTSDLLAFSQSSPMSSSRRTSTTSAARRHSHKHHVNAHFLASQLASLEAMELLPVWQEEKESRRRPHRLSSQSSQLRMAKVRQVETDNADNDVYEQGNGRVGRCLARLVVHPSSVKRLAWDLVGFTFLSYDIVLIPFATAFELQASRTIHMVNIVTLLYWTLDMVASMMTGFPQDGVTIMVHKRIVAKYFRTWFLLDAFLVGLDWTMTIGFGDANEAVRQGRSLRMLRYARTIRLVRLLRLGPMLHEIQDHLSTELLSTVFSILRTIVGLVVANHLIACAWYALGQSGAEDEPSWVRGNDMQDRSIAYKYTTSLHWSLTQFTPASMEIRPFNEAERVFSVVVLLLALVSFSSFVSTLTASISRLSAMRTNEHRQFWLLRRYLRELRISRQLSFRVQRYCEYSWRRKQLGVQERDVGLLTHLSGPLREELKAETFAPHLSVHPLIEQLQDCVRRFSSALTASEIARGDQVFGYGEVAHDMYFVAHGELQYSVGDGDDESAPSPRSSCSEDEGSEASTKSETVEPVFESDWVSEPALWLPWEHLGYLEALTDCQLVALKASTFGEVVSQNAATLSSAKKYARKYVEELNKIDRRRLTDVMERGPTYTAAEELGAAMPCRSASGAVIRKRRKSSYGQAEYRFRNGTHRLRLRMSIIARRAFYSALRCFT